MKAPSVKPSTRAPKKGTPSKVVSNGGKKPQKGPVISTSSPSKKTPQKGKTTPKASPSRKVSDKYGGGTEKTERGEKKGGPEGLQTSTSLQRGNAKTTRKVGGNPTNGKSKGVVSAGQASQKTPPSPHDFYGVVKHARDSAKDKGKDPVAAAKMAAGLAGDLELLGLGKDGASKQKAMDEFYKNPTKEGREKASTVAISEVYNLPVDKVNEALGGSRGSTPVPNALMNLIAATELLGDTEANGLMKDPKYWDRVKEKGVDQALKDSIARVFNLPKNIVNDPAWKPKAIMDKIADVNLGKSNGDYHNPNFWAGKNKVGSNSVAKPGANKGKKTKKVGAKTTTPSRSDTGGVSSSHINGKTGSGASQTGAKGKAAGSNNAGQSGTSNTNDIAGVSGNASGQSNSSGSTSNRDGTSNQSSGSQAIGAGAPNSGSTGVGSSSDAKGFGAGTEAKPGQEPERSGSFAVVTNNEDGTVTFTHITVFDDGEASSHDTETYTKVDGVWTNERGEEYHGINGNDGPPEDGAYPTEYGEDGSYTMHPASSENDEKSDSSSTNDSSDSSNSSSSEPDSDSNDSDDSENDGSDCSGQSDCGSDSGSDDSESEDGDAEEPSSSAGRPAPDADLVGASPGQLSIVTGGRVGNDEKRNQERGLDYKRGGGVIDPVDDGSTAGGISEKDAERAIGMATGGGVDAPNRTPENHTPNDRELRDAIIRAGGGYKDPPEDGGTPSNGGAPPQIGPLSPPGTGPLAASHEFANRIGKVRAVIRALNIE